MGKIKYYQIFVGNKAKEEEMNATKKGRLQSLLNKFNELINRTEQLINSAQDNIISTNSLIDFGNSTISVIESKRSNVITAYNDHKAIYDALDKLSNNLGLTSDEKFLLTSTFGVNESDLTSDFGLDNKGAYEQYLNELIALTNDLGIDVAYAARAIEDDLNTVRSLLNTYILSNAGDGNDNQLEEYVGIHKEDIETLLNNIIIDRDELESIFNEFNEENDYIDVENDFNGRYDHHNNVYVNKQDITNDDHDIIDNYRQQIDNIRNKIYDLPAEPGIVIPEPKYMFYIGGTKPTLSNTSWHNDQSFTGAVNYQEISNTSYPASTSITVPNEERGETPSYIYVVVSRDKEVEFWDPSADTEITRAEGPIALDANNVYYMCYDAEWDSNTGDTVDAPWSNGAPIEIHIRRASVIPEPIVVNVTGLAINKTNITIDANESTQIIGTVSPSDSTDKTIIWESSDTSKATITSQTQSGQPAIIQWRGAGNVTITAKAKDNPNELQRTCQVTLNNEVIDDQDYYWYVGYDQDLYDNTESSKSKMLTLTTNEAPTNYTRTSGNTFYMNGQTPNYIIMVIPTTWTTPSIGNPAGGVINLGKEKSNISISGISGITFDVYSTTSNNCIIRDVYIN